MSFRALTPDQRVLVIEGYLAGIPDPFPVRLPAATEEAVRRAKRILAQPELPEDVQLAERERWEQHLDDLSEHDADAAVHALDGFVQILKGVLAMDEPATGEEDE
jgi:hypothetical protein